MRQAAAESLRSARILWFALLLIACEHVGGRGQVMASGEANWRTDKSLSRQLRSTVDISWSEISLRQALRRLSESQSVAIFLDRRVDPDQLIELDATDVPLQTAMSRLAASRQCDVAWVGPVAYVGPRGTVARLNRLLVSANRQLERLPEPRRERLRRSHALRWNELTEPKVAIAELATSYHVDLSGRQRIPYDLWPAADLPPLDFVQAMTLVAYGFGLTFELDEVGESARLVPLPRTVVSAQETTQRDSDIHTANRAGQVDSLANKRFTLTYEGYSANKLIELLARKYSLEVRIAEDVESRLDQIISIQVAQATFDQLLMEILTPLQLTYELRGQSLAIRRDGG